MKKYGVAYGDNACLHASYRLSKPLVIACDSEEEAIKTAKYINGVAFSNMAEKTEVDMAYIVTNRILSQ